MRILLSIVFFFAILFVRAQDFSSQFNEFKTSQEQEYVETLRRQDSAFAQSILDNWKQFELLPMVNREKPIKPDKQPTASDSLRLRNYQHKIFPNTPSVIMRSFDQPYMEFEETSFGDEILINFVFYGHKLAISISGNFDILRNEDITNVDKLFEAWNLLSQTSYSQIIAQLEVYKRKLSIPDYAYLLLVKNFVREIVDQHEVREVYVWFILTKSGYLTRIGLIDSKPVLVIGSYGIIYHKRYYTENGINFFVMSELQGDFETFSIPPNESERGFDLAILNLIKLPLNPVSRKIEYTSENGEKIKFNLLYNNNAVEMLSQFPQSNIAFYLCSGGSDLFEKSIEKAFQSYLDGLNDIQQIQFLLEFVQKGFPYRADNFQFGHEYVMYPEQTLHFPYLDCDDRVVLLSFLIRKFLKKPTVAVSFTNHIVLGVRLSSPVFGESISYKGYNFSLIDPTFFNAPIGAIIPQVDRSHIEVIEY